METCVPSTLVRGAVRHPSTSSFRRLSVANLGAVTNLAVYPRSNLLSELPAVRSIGYQTLMTELIV